MWRLLNKSNNKLEGLRLLRQLSKLCQAQILVQLELICTFQSIILKYKTGIINFIALNPLINKYKIAKIQRIKKLQRFSNDEKNTSIYDISLETNNFEYKLNKAAKNLINLKGSSILIEDT